MCGIAGIFSLKERLIDKDIIYLRSMISTLNHRGPDDTGLWKSEDNFLSLAHKRLSILDLLKHGSQPMASYSSRYIISYNGEIYNHLKLRESLQKNDRFKSTSDTETILSCIEEWGLKRTLNKIEGMFAFALWDKEKRKLYLCRDRYGEKPLYYFLFENKFYFASELKAIQKIHKDKLTINHSSVEIFLQSGWLPDHCTIYEGVKKLVSGAMLSLKIDSKEPIIENYWSINKAAEIAISQPFTGSYSDAQNILDDLINSTVKQEMISDVPIGCALSGGIDSTLISYYMQNNSTNKINTFTVGFESNEYNEANYAKEIAHSLDFEHHEIYLTDNDVVKSIESIINIYDEPFADVSQIPTYLISRLASSKVKVLLGGDGGDEIFGGYTRHLAARKIVKIINIFPHNLRSLLSQILLSLNPSAIEFCYKYFFFSNKHIHISNKVHKFAEVIKANTFEQVYLYMIGLSFEKSNTFFNNYYQLNPDNIDEMLNYDMAQKTMLYDTAFYLPGDILTKIDRASMSVSLETRSPFLNHKISEFAWSLPMEFKINGNSQKDILKKILLKKIPNYKTNRPKSGFSIPIGEWLRTSLKKWAIEIISDFNNSKHGYFSEVAVMKFWYDHTNNTINNEKVLWNIIIFQLWYNKYI